MYLFLSISFCALAFITLIIIVTLIIQLINNAVNEKAHLPPLYFTGFSKAAALVFGVLTVLCGVIYSCFYPWFPFFGCDLYTCETSVQPVASFVLFLIPVFLYFVYTGGFWIRWINHSERMHLTPEHPEEDHRLGINYKKGLAGRSFADLATSMGVLVAVGLNLVFDSFKGNFWWLGQIAAMVSVISVASWVHRFIIEGPGEKRRTERTWMYHFNSIAAILTAVTLLIPTDKIVDKTNAALVNFSWMKFWIFLIWMVIFCIWFISTIFPLLFIKQLPSWKKRVSYDPADGYKTEGYKKYFVWALIYTAIIFLVAIYLLAKFGSYDYTGFHPDPYWSLIGRGLLGTISAGLLILRQLSRIFLIVIEWVGAKTIDKYRYQDLEKSVLSLLGGVAILILQILIWINAGDVGAVFNLFNQTWQMIYVVYLVLMAAGAFLGVVGDAVRVIEKTPGAALSAEALLKIYKKEAQSVTIYASGLSIEKEQLEKARTEAQANAAVADTRAREAEARAREAEAKIIELQARSVASSSSSPTTVVQGSSPSSSGSVASK